MDAATRPADANPAAGAVPDPDVKRGLRPGLLDVGVLAAAMLIFLLFLMLLVRIVFPQGSRLGDLAEDRAQPEAVAVRGEVGLLGRGTDSIGGFLARLADVKRDVKIRPADSVAWRSASLGSTVRNRDALQTFSNSRARVDFTTDNELQIGQNSLVVFRSGAADPFLQRRDPAVVLMGGDMEGSVNADYGAFAVQLPVGVAELTAEGTADDEVRFRVGINPDESSSLSVYAGRADVSIGDRQYRVAANQGLTVSADGSSAEITTLPGVPLVRAPADGRVARFLETPPRVTFRWSEAARAERYRIEIAADESFDEIVVDEVLSQPAFTHANLSPGTYFWRVSARNGWVLGPATLPRSIRVLQDTAPPSLEVGGIERLADGRYVIRGRTARDATVRVMGAAAAVAPDGTFEHVFLPRPGSQTIVVEAIDGVGNVAFSSQVLHVPGTTGRSN